MQEKNREKFDISIIIVNWNTKKFLVQCLQSINRNIKNIKHEIYVVDNASSDGSPNAVERQFPYVKLIKNKINLGFAAANNIAINHCSGRYICLINSDVVILPFCIENLFSFMEKHSEVGIVSPRILNPDRTLQPNWKWFPSFRQGICRALAIDRFFPKSPYYFRMFPYSLRHDFCRKVEVLTGCFWMVRREAIVRVGLLDENFFMYGEDIDWCRRFHDAGWGIIYYPGAEAIHYGEASSSKDPIKFYLEMQKSRLYYWQKYYGKLRKNLYLIIILFSEILRIIIKFLFYGIYPPERKTEIFKIKRSIECIKWIMNKNKV